MTIDISRFQVPVDKLRWRLDPSTLPFESTDELNPLTEIIGQERGVEAFRFGMAMEKKGYNIFVTGPAHIGKQSMSQRLLKKFSRKDEVPDDLCYVNNFKDPDAPILLRFKAGQGAAFKGDVDEFLENIKREAPQLYESQEYIISKKKIIETHEKKVREFYKGLEAKVKEAGFALVNVQMGEQQRPDIAPIIDDKPVPLFELEESVQQWRFPKERFLKLQETYKVLKTELDAIFLEIRDLQKEVKKKGEEVDRLLFMEMAKALTKPLVDGYPEEKAQGHVEAMLEDMADNLDKLRAMGAGQQGPGGQMFAPPPPEVILHPYKVNLLVDNAEQVGPPIVVESNPTYRNLFGTIERVMDRSGMWRTDYSKIHGGSFVKANGGYLVLNLMDAIQEPGVWQTLKRALKTSEIEIQTFDPMYFVTSTGLTPEPIEMNVKVAVVAEPQLYYMLRRYDPDVANIFKVRADFGEVMERNSDAVNEVARFIRTYCEESKVRPLDRDGVAALVERSVRMAGRQEKLSTAFPELGDLLDEADFLANRDKAKHISRAHVEEALDARVYRANRMEEYIQEMVDRGSLFIDTDGSAVGQVNGLAVYHPGDYAFGKPSRITAAVSMGREGIINIEREAELSGATHNKGMFILSGYLRRKFAQDKPLTLAASIAFEQSYGGVDGDSASSTELYAILSSLTDVPLRQDIAVTGSVNQKGEVQPIGGANEKIEGFYLCCKHAGLTGKQGVMIPHPNIKDLMLSTEVTQAVEQGKFHIYAVKTVDEGIEVLTGVRAGKRNAEGAYPKNSINALADARLTELAEGLRAFGGKDDNNKGKKKAKAKKDEGKEK